jgi:prepilin-type processing-associated H-X9-DG protein
MVLFADNIVALPAETKGWHKPQPAGNVVMLDGHNQFTTALAATNMLW